PFSPLDDNFRKVTQESVEKIYTVFVNRVAAVRNMTFEQVDAIAQGRVWSGSEALQIGLIDNIGGLQAAIDAAAKIAKIDNYQTLSLPEYETSFEEMLGISPFGKAKSALLREEIGEENYVLFERIKQLNNRKGVQALLPYELSIK